MMTANAPAVFLSNALPCMTSVKSNVMRMYPSKNAISLLPALLLGLHGNAAHADERYAFDKKHTAINFSVTSFGISQVKGQFSDYDGDFVFCMQHPDKDAVAITLYPAGIHTGDEETDNELRGTDFNAQQFPRIRFVSTAINLIDKDHAKVTGNLILLGITKPITLDAHFTKKEHDPKSGDYVVNFSASGVIKRSDFGMTHLSAIVGDEVRLSIEVEGIDEEDAELKKL